MADQEVPSSHFPTEKWRKQPESVWTNFVGALNTKDLQQPSKHSSKKKTFKIAGKFSGVFTCMAPCLPQGSSGLGL